MEKLAITWENCNLSFTPKMHTLLNHIHDQLDTVDDFTKMGEDIIELSHQHRYDITTQWVRIRDKSKVMVRQAKLQDISVKKEIKEFKEIVRRKSERKLKRAVGLKEGSDKTKKIKRQEKRESQIDLNSNSIKLVDGRDLVRKDARNL